MPTVGPPSRPPPEADPDLRNLVQLPPGKRAAGAEDGTVPEGPHSSWGGLGMAIYALVLVFLGVAGFAGMIGATYGLIMASSSRYSELKSGAEVAVWRAQPLRDAGLIGLSEVPMAWHDESEMLDGTIACATTPEALIRVTPDSAQKVAFSQLTAVRTEGNETDGVTVTATGSDTVVCTFGPQEGGLRFARQIRIAAGLPAE